MPNVNLTMPTDYSVELEGIRRRRKLAEFLQAQSMQPVDIPSPSGGWAVPMSWTQGLAQMAKGAVGGMAEKRETEREKALAKAMREGTSRELEQFEKTRAGTPAAPGVESVAFEGGRGPGTPAVPGDINAAYAGLARSQNPMLQQAALARMLKGDEDYTLAPDATRMRGNQVIARGAPRTPTQQGNWSQPYQMGGAWVQRNDTTGQIRQSVGREPQIRIENPAAVTAVTIQDPKNPNATIIVDGRTGRVIGPGPKLTDTGKMETKRQFNMQGIGGLIQQADDLLNGLARDPSGVTTPVPTPTGSGVGAAYDYAAGIFGASPAGSVQAQQMKAIGGALTAKMPRMEGPQSDRDVALYKEMAAQVGDPMVPIARRKAALDTVKQLWSKYERLNPDAFQDRRTGGANVVDFNS